jgi:hypothetical protein
MMIARKMQIVLIPAVFLFCASACFAQHNESSAPLGDKLKKALEQSSLTGAHAKPFHVKVHLSESSNPASLYRAEIEESWASPQQWTRVIETPDFKQTLIVNRDKSSELDHRRLLSAMVEGLCERPL